MPSDPTEPRDHRRHRILTVLARHQVRNQGELQQQLAALGIEVTQATLSRDLRDLGVVKGKDGYEMPGGKPALEDARQSLWHAARAWLLAAAPALNQVVLRTPPGCAQPLGLAIDRSPPAGVLGTIAGDDTVLVICRSTASARALARRLLQDAVA